MDTTIGDGSTFLLSGHPMLCRRRLILMCGAMLLLGSGCRLASNKKQVSTSWIDAASVRAVTRSAENTVILVVNGGDPLQLAQADTFTDRFRAAGYPNAYLVEWHQSEAFEEAIREIHREHPEARVVLIGYSLGAYSVRSVANHLIRDGVPVAMVGYIGGDYLTDTPETQLAGVPRLVNVTGDGHPLTGRNLFFNGIEVTGARNLRLGGTRHFDLLQNPNTFAVMLEELERPNP